MLADDIQSGEYIEWFLSSKDELKTMFENSTIKVPADFPMKEAIGHRPGVRDYCQTPGICHINSGKKFPNIFRLCR